MLLSWEYTCIKRGQQDGADSLWFTKTGLRFSGISPCSFPSAWRLWLPVPPRRKREQMLTAPWKWEPVWEPVQTQPQRRVQALQGACCSALACAKPASCQWARDCSSPTLWRGEHCDTPWVTAVLSHPLVFSTEGTANWGAAWNCTQRANLYFVELL